MTCSSYGVLRLLILHINSGEPQALITGEYKMEFWGKAEMFLASLRVFLRRLDFYFKRGIDRKNPLANRERNKCSSDELLI